jgi:uncharacterized repeat protein (TIGR01451 family)
MNAGQTVTLTFTISNVAGAPAQTGLTFSDALPANLLIAATPNVVNGCGGTPTVTATAGTGTFTIGGTGVNSAIGPSTCTISVNVTSSVAGSYVNGAVQVTTNMNNSVTNQTLTVAALPSLTFLKTVSVYSDPMNGTTNPKFIPGAIAEYAITASNSGGLADANSIFITDLLPPNTLLLVDDMALPVGSGPVQFIQGGTSSTLTYTKATDLVFSNNSGGNWLAGPAASGCDPAINAIRINPKGTFVGGGSSFQLKFRVCIQ